MNGKVQVGFLVTKAVLVLSKFRNSEIPAFMHLMVFEASVLLETPKGFMVHASPSFVKRDTELDVLFFVLSICWIMNIKLSFSSLSPFASGTLEF